MPYKPAQWRAIAADYERRLGRKRARRKLHELKSHAGQRLRDKRPPIR